MWEKSSPGFRADSLLRVGVEPAFRAGWLQPLNDVYPPPPDQELVFRVLSANSPDGRYKLVFDRYQSIDEDAGEIETGGDPDSAPLLIDLRRRTFSQFETCGTPCGFDWGVWLSPSRFALAGWREADVAGQQRQGRIKIFSIRDSTATTYVTRPVSAGEFALYRDAWRDWIASRLHVHGGATKTGEN